MRHSSLERLASVRTRNLLEAHALRTGRKREEIESEVLRQVRFQFHCPLFLAIN